MRIKLFASLIIIFLLQGVATAQENGDLQSLVAIPLSPTQSPRYINDSIRVYYTIDTLTGIEAMQAINKGSLIKNVHKKKANVNLAENGFWLLFRLKNNSTTTQEYYLELAYNRTDLIKLYNVDGNSVNLEFETGDVFNFNQRPVEYRNFAFPLLFSKNQERTILLNLEKRNTVDRFPLKIYSKEKFYHHKGIENIIYGLFFGIISLIVIVSIGISFYMRIPMFAYYGLYTLSVGIFLFTSLGLTFQVITPNTPSFNYNNLGLLVPISVFLMIKFCQSFFSTKKYFKTIHIVYNILSVNLLILLTIWVLAPNVYQAYAVAILNFTYIIILSVFSLSFFTAHQFRKINYTNAILFGFGYTASFIGIGYAILIDTGIVYSNLFTDSSLSIISGIFVEFIFLTSAMAIYIRRRFKYFDYNKAYRNPPTLDNGKGKFKNDLLLGNDIIIESYSSKLGTLTVREKEVLQLIANGKTSNQIAESLYLSIHTIQTHRKRIWKKLDIKSYNELIKIATAFELVSEN